MDPYTQAVSVAIQAIAEAVKSENELDLYLAQGSEVYREALIKERLARKEFWQPLLDLFGRMKP